jgi:hypothetical protein
MNRAHLTPCSLALLALLAFGCSDDGANDDGGVTPVGTREELMDPQTCEGCHPRHFEQWSGSMHAYAAQDPVFLAMNERGQRETDGALGDFCINCHAPMAVREGLTTDGLNLDEVPDHLEGVTCYFCHNAVEVTGTHNAALELANDTTLRGGIEDPVSNAMHGVEYSSLHDADHTNSSKLCGACHDIVTPKKVELERTFQEWRESVFADPTGGGFGSCGSCHMDVEDGVAAEDEDVQVPPRDVHNHMFPGVDVALNDFPGIEEQTRAIRCALQFVVNVRLCPFPDGRVEVFLEANAGHKWPSGAAQDRRAWLELLAYDENDEVFWSTGRIADDEIVDKAEGEPGFDPNLWVMRDRIFDDAGEPTHMFWEAASYESLQLPSTISFDIPHSQKRIFQLGSRLRRLEARVRIRPMDFDVLQDLVDSDDLDPAVLERIQTFTPQLSEVHWSRDVDGVVNAGFVECAISGPDSPELEELDCTF